ncbi:MAG: ATP-binding protein, partial [Eubacterium sp.]|nr:ATP-binding protein [Eubacterium sp.]
LVFSLRIFKARKITSGEALKRFGWKNILISLAAVLFFVGLITTYMLMLYSASKETITARGELHSVESANSLNRYISQGTAIVRQTRYELDKMMDGGCSEKDIQDYMVSHTDSIQHTLDENYTGLYGYINGKYYDGANWVPDEGWVATERPWYKKAVESNGKIALIEPYIDAQTGLLTMTAAVAMNDRKNVVAIDVSFSMIKTVTEETSESSDKIEMVLDASGAVIAHSDDQEIGKNYLEEKGTLGAAVAEQLYATYDQCFELSYDGVDYVVYCVNMNNEWYSLTLIDSEESYEPMRILVFVTIIIILLTVAILAAIFINISSKTLAVERLNVQLKATSEIYLLTHDIDLIHDTYTNLYVTPRMLSYLEQEGSSAREAIYNVISATTMVDTKNAALEFVDLDTLEERMDGKNTIAMEFHVKDGRWMRGRFIISERTAEGHISHVLWMVESVDEEKRKRDDLQDMTTRAIAESEAKSAFLSNMSHEIRTPITAVLGMNEMVLRECKDPNVLNYAESIETAGHTLLGLVNDILDFSKIEAGKMEIIPVEYDLSSVLNDLVNMTQIRIEEKGLILNLRFERTMPSMLYGDEVRIKQVITNILTNAVKYTERGEVTFSMWSEKLTDDPSGVRLIVEVRDTGIGIREEDMDKLFARFDRIEEQRNRNIEGTGLGMTITKKLLELMDGRMEVESTYGEGSTFRIYLKQKVVDWAPIGDYEETYHKHISEKDGYKEIFTAPEASVLVVDDTQMNLMVFKSLLKSTEVQIDTAISGDDGLALMAQKHYDVIFLDHMMPRKDGIQTLKEMRADETGLNHETPVICLTANAISGAREMYMKEGFDNYMTKPIDSAKLEEMLASYLPADKVQYVAEVDEMESFAETAGSVTIASGEEAAEAAEPGTGEPVALSPMYRPHPGINLVGAMEGMGSEEAFKPILDIFYETIDENSQEIDDLYNAEEWEDYTILVHALKSSARIVGALDLGEAAFAMEMAGKERNLDYVHANHEKLMTDYRAFKDILRDIYEEVPEDTDAGDRPEASTLTVGGWYERIRAGAENMDIMMLEDVFAEAAEYRLTPEDAERMKELKRLSESFDYDRILDEIGKIR